MACFHPLSAYRLAGGGVTFKHEREDTLERIELPCGQCIGCRLERSRQWALRCAHEASLYDKNCFVTLTYDEEHLPCDYSLNYRHFQLFMKRLRKRFRPCKIRFFMCGEYGEHNFRPHYHVCFFGFNFPDLDKISGGDHPLYTSAILSELWPYGFHTIGALSFESAAYTARYCLKKVTGDAAEAHYTVTDDITGEIYHRKPEFANMSRNPGIGKPWLDKFAKDVYTNDYVVIDGKKVRPPKYYDRKTFDDPDTPFDIDHIQHMRSLDGRAHADNNTSDRLAVRKEVTLARLKFYTRSI